MLASLCFAQDSGTTLQSAIMGDWVGGQRQSITSISFKTNGTAHWAMATHGKTNTSSGLYSLHTATNAVGFTTHYISVVESIVASRGLLLLEDVDVRLDQRFNAEKIGPVLVATRLGESLVFIRKERTANQRLEGTPLRGAPQP